MYVKKVEAMLLVRSNWSVETLHDSFNIRSNLYITATLGT